MLYLTYKIGNITFFMLKIRKSKKYIKCALGTFAIFSKNLKSN